MSHTADLRIVETLPLITPALLEKEFPLSAEGERLVNSSRAEISACLENRDRRLLVIVGPCSIHDVNAALDYASRLLQYCRPLREQLTVVLRVYFEKPRTVVGWKGLINDPDLDGTFRINSGLRLARKLLLDVIGLGLPAATEFLDTTFGQYYADSISFGAIGARTVESQIHRELASGLSMPVGIKNRTDGDIDAAIDAILAARQSHWFPSLTRHGMPASLKSKGNDQCYLVLRGGNRSGPNYGPDSVALALEKLEIAGLPRSLIVDCSHGNSLKEPARQKMVAERVAEQIEAGQRGIRGVMIESHLVGGSQVVSKNRELVYGQSITDACLSIDETVPVLERLAAAVRRSS